LRPVIQKDAKILPLVSGPNGKSIKKRPIVPKIHTVFNPLLDVNKDQKWTLSNSFIPGMENPLNIGVELADFRNTELRKLQVVKGADQKDGPLTKTRPAGSNLLRTAGLLFTLIYLAVNF
jgi:hypothetical protein